MCLFFALAHGRATIAIEKEKNIMKSVSAVIGWMRGGPESIPELLAGQAATLQFGLHRRWSLGLASRVLGTDTGGDPMTLSDTRAGCAKVVRRVTSIPAPAPIEIHPTPLPPF